jgi:hypothetical protein
MKRLLPLFLLLAATPAAAQKAFVLQSDFVSGSLASVNGATYAVQEGVNSVHSDARARWFGDTLVVLNRFGADNVQLVNAATGGTIRQFSTGNGSNPGDVAWITPSKMYVTRYEQTELLVVNPQTGAHTGAIALGAFADADGIPEMDRMVRIGPHVFVTLQRLNRDAGFTPTDTSLVVVIDTRTDAVVDCDAVTPGVQAIRLARTNPVTDFVREPGGGLLVGCAGAYGVLDGGVVRLDPFALTAGGVAIGEAELGGDVGDLEWHTAQKSYAIVSDAAFNTVLVSWNPATGLRLAPIFSPGGYSLPDMNADGTGRLWVCNNSFGGPGLHVFDMGTDLPARPPLALALPPVSVLFGAPLPPAAAPAAPVALALTAPRPNPARGPVQLSLALPEAAVVRADVLDVAGRRVGTIASGAHGAGVHELRWDLRDLAGAPVAPGVYRVRVRSGVGEATRRVLVVR